MRLARVTRAGDGFLTLEWCLESDIALDHTHVVKAVQNCVDGLDLDTLDLTYDDILCNSGITRLLSIYSTWRSSQLKQLTKAHNIQTPSRANRGVLQDLLLSHDCDQRCQPYVVVFTTLTKLRASRGTSALNSNTVPASMRSDSDASYLQVADESLRNSIIKEWQSTVSTSNLERGVCAPCGRGWSRKDLTTVHPSEFHLALLRNDAIPPASRPTNYAFQLYGRALLEPMGMSSAWTLSSFDMCAHCRRAILEKGRTPRLSLANWLYYGHEALPSAVSDAFDRSSQFDRLLVARARASRISFRFTELRSDHGANKEPFDAHESHVSSQRYVKGNVLVMPQNSTQFNNVLPPSPSVIRDTVCAVFVGRSAPTIETIAGLSPILARRSTVETIIKFLILSNPHYEPDEDFIGLSETNLDALFATDRHPSGEGVPCCMDIGFIEETDAIRATTADYTGRNDIADPPPSEGAILMENVGYTSGDKSPVSYRDMKLRALSHCLNGGRFIRSQAGDTFVPDFHNPALLTWLFPHLDPWGIGGFHHPARVDPISMDEQLRYLLQRADGRFQRDPDFAFVYFNILHATVYSSGSRKSRNSASSTACLPSTRLSSSN